MESINHAFTKNFFKKGNFFTYINGENKKITSRVEDVIPESRYKVNTVLGLKEYVSDAAILLNNGMCVRIEVDYTHKSKNKVCICNKENIALLNICNMQSYETLKRKKEILQDMLQEGLKLSCSCDSFFLQKVSSLKDKEFISHYEDKENKNIILGTANGEKVIIHTTGNNKNLKKKNEFFWDEVFPEKEYDFSIDFFSNIC